MSSNSNPRALKFNKAPRNWSVKLQPTTTLVVVCFVAVPWVFLLGNGVWWSAGLFLLGNGAWFFRHAIENCLDGKRWGTVVAGKIYRSGQLSKRRVERTLRKHGIKVVINLRGRRHIDPARIEEAAVIERLGIENLWLPLKGDGTGDPLYYVKAIERMVLAEKENKPVLVHCAAGTQRTGGVIAAYRLLVQGASPGFVYNDMKKYNWKPKKNGAVLEYLNDNMEVLARTLVEKKVLECMPRPVPRLAPNRLSRHE